MANITPKKWTRFSAFAPRQVMFASGMKWPWTLLLISMLIPVLNLLVIFVMFFVWWLKGTSRIKNSKNYTDEQKDGIIGYFNSLQTLYFTIFFLSILILWAYMYFVISWWLFSMFGKMTWFDPAILDAMWGLEWLEWLQWLNPADIEWLDPAVLQQLEEGLWGIFDAVE